MVSYKNFIRTNIANTQKVFSAATENTWALLLVVGTQNWDCRLVHRVPKKSPGQTIELKTLQSNKPKSV